MRDMGPILSKIERLEKNCAYWNNKHSKETERADKLQKQIESFKAITELAVKGFKEVMQYAPMGSAAFNVAVSAIGQIEKLRHE